MSLLLLSWSWPRLLSFAVALLIPLARPDRNSAAQNVEPAALNQPETLNLNPTWRFMGSYK